jgi:hypothetical protein
MIGKKYLPLRYNNKTYVDYMVCNKGRIYKIKLGKLTEVSICYPSKRNSSPYARCAISVEGNRRKTLLVHIAVCDTWNRDFMPIPEGVSKAEWKQTPTAVKAAMRFIYQVNHIDHDQHNHHPSNLEYVTAQKNQQKYQEHRLKLIA